MSMQSIVKTCLTLVPVLWVAAPVVSAPANDQFADRIALRSLIVSTEGSNADATREFGEPDHISGTGDRSVWWSWTAPASGLASITTSNSAFDTLLAVYTGASVGALTLVTNNDDALGLWPQSAVQFDATAGTVYQIAVDGFGRPDSASGRIQLNIVGPPEPNPVLPPVVELRQPVEGQVLRVGDIVLAVEAYDDDGGITNVEFFADTSPLGADVLHPFNLVWSNVPVGDYALTAVATDNSGMASTSAVVNVSVVLNPPPLVSLISPTNTQPFTVPLDLPLSASAVDDDGIDHVEFFSGTNKLGEAAIEPYGLVWDTVIAGDYALTAVAFDSLGAAATSAVVHISVTGNYPPLVSLTGPPDQSSYAAPTNLTLTADASDIDGVVAKVEFFQGAAKLGESLSTPFEFAWNNISTGQYVLSAVATDDGGLTATSVPISITVTQQVFTFTNTLISAGSVWRYLDNGTDQGAAWAASGFDDSGWRSGPAQLGYGDGDEATIVSYGPDAGNKYVTTYFRQTFNVTDADTYTNLTLQMLVDDGGIVYLNGAEVLRHNLPFGPVNYRTLASLSAQNGDTIVGEANPGLLVDGPNVLGVEIHQANFDSSDISFDLELVGISDKSFSNGPPTITIISPTNNASFEVPLDLAIEAAAQDDFGIARVAFFDGATQIGEDTLAPYQVTIPNALPGVHVLTAVATDDFNVMSTSAVVTVTLTGNYPPFVDIRSPADGAQMVAPADILIDVQATDIDGTVASVQYYQGANWLGETLSPPHQWDWNGVGLGEYDLLAVATDNLGATQTSAVVHVSVLLNVPPVVTIDQPIPNSAFINTEAIRILVTATDIDDGVSRVEFFQGTTRLGEDLARPYEFTWSNMATGTYHLSAVATDFGGLSRTSPPVRITVVDPAQAFGGLGFDGNNDYVTFGAAPELGLANFTLETWFKWTGNGIAISTGGGGVRAIPLVAKGRGESDGNNLDMNYFLGIDPLSGVLAADFEGDAGPWAGVAHPVTGTNIITLNVWHHAAASYDGLTWRLYLDGVLDAQLDYPGGRLPRADSIQHASLGSALNSSGAPSGYFAGVLDEVRIWNYARTPSEILSNRVVQIAAAPGLVGRWALDETGGLTAADSAGNGVNGTLVNGPFWTLGYPFVSPPSVRIASPLADAVFFTPAAINIEAAASDEDGTIDLVEFFAGGTKIGETTNSPFAFIWSQAPPGFVELTAVAIDNSGLATTSAPVAILVENSIVRLTSPAHLATFVSPDPIPLVAEVSDTNGTIVRVDFFDGNALLGAATTRPFAFDWLDAALGEHHLSAVATDDGGIQNTSAVIRLTVVSNIPPRVALFSPRNNSTHYFPTNVALTASASDTDGRVTNVAFFANGAPVAAVATPPYRAIWMGPALGAYGLTAVATDDRGLAATSAVVNVTIATNSPPVVAITSPADNQGFFAPAEVALEVQVTDLDGVARVEYFAGTNKVGETASSPFSFVWSGVPIGQYQLQAVATDPFGLSGFSAPISIVVTNNDPPVVTLLSPTNNAVFSDQDDVPLTATATDSDGIQRVEFFSGNQSLGDAFFSPYQAVWSRPGSGGHFITAVATDGVGLQSTSAPVSISVIGSVATTNLLTAFGADWKFLDDGSDQGTSWSGVSFDDSTWRSGPAELGYGDGDEATIVSFGSSSANKHITTYFRHAFVVTNASQFDFLYFQLKYDDGGVVYLNGTEIFRVNLPSGAINYLTDTPSTAENAFAPGSASPGLLRDGTNVLAVEIHQERPSSSDISFDFELAGVFNNSLPTVFLAQPTNTQTFTAPVDVPLAVDATDIDGRIVQVDFFVDGEPIGEDTSAPFEFTWTNVTYGGDFALTAVATDDAGGATVSPAVNIHIIGNQRPVVRITAPADGAAFVAPTTIVISADAVDPDGSVTNVAFLANGQLLGELAAGPFNFNWVDALVDDYILTVVATDNEGVSIESAPVQVSLLNVPPPQDLVLWGAEWRYLADGSDPGTAWPTLGFDDASWLRGAAELGYGEGDETTSLPRNGSQGFIRAFYFRNNFVVTDPTVYKTLALRVRMDDGAVVYINGNEVLRGNMPFGTVNYRTYASGTGENTEMSTNAPASLLRSGTNVVAVEVHQRSSGSSDVSFNLELIGNTTNGLPTVALTEPQDQSVFIEPVDLTVSAAATDNDGAVTNVMFFQDGLLLGQDSIPPYSILWQNVTADRYELTAVAFDNFGDSSTSGVVNVFVVVSTAPTVESFDPAPGPVTQFDQLTVNFGEPVDGVDAADLLVNGLPATAMTGANAAYTFFFAQPSEGAVFITWAPDHGIVDREDPPKPFNSRDMVNLATFQLSDTVAPTVVRVNPPPGATVNELTRLRVTFSEPVGGVQDQDLLINGVPAQRVNGALQGPYDFEFAQPTNVTSVQISWSTNHGIHDFARARNEFAGDSWTYTLGSAAVEAGLVINEIMYHPASELISEEFLELHNTSGTPLNLTGWELTGGVDFVFPNVTIPAGGYLVIAADVAAFQAKYPGVTDVVGGWVGRLSNNDDVIRLRNALGEVVDRVAYASEGDWAIRQRGELSSGSRGWDWYAEHDGLALNTANNQTRGNRSLELRNPAMPNDNGQNWDASGPENGTPGQPNSVLTSDVAPLIYDAAHFPSIPTSQEGITFTARVVDEAPAGPAAVELNYRVANSASPPPFTTVGMFDDGQHNDGAAGDGVFGAAITEQPNGTVVEYYVSARDGAGNTRTWPAAARQLDGSFAQTVNALLQVDDENYTGGMPIYRIIMTQTELQDLDGGSRQSNAPRNATLVTSDGVDIKVRQNVGVRIRGQGSRGRTPPNFRVNIPNDRRWNGLSSINLNTQFPHAQLAGNIVTLKSGVPSAAARVVQVRVNGQNRARSAEPVRGSSTGSGFGVYVMLEPHNGAWAARHFPDDPNGNVYRGIPPGGGWGARLDWRGTDQASYYNSYSKNSNRGENDWSDLVELSRVLSSGLPDDQFVREVRKVINVEEWMRYFAVGSLIVYSENGLLTGVGDDYAMYRGIKDPRFLMVMHDLDTDFGEGDGDWDAWGPASTIWLVSDRPGGNLPWANRFLKHNEFAPIYFQQLKELTDTVFSAAEFNPLLDRLLGGWVPGPIIDRMKAHTAQRVANVLNQIPRNYSANTGLPTVSGFLRSTASIISLNGSGNALETRAVRVNGIPASWTAWTGQWTLSNFALHPGINRVVVQWLDEHGLEVNRNELQVWYDDGTPATVPTSISSDLMLTAAGGPYQVANNVTVQPGATLTIEPGTTLYFAQGTRLNIDGVLVAQGNENNRIRMTRSPGTAATWGGIVFSDTMADNRLMFVDMEYASTADPVVVDNSRVRIENVVWTGTTRTIVDMTFASVIIRNCVFPTIVGNETIHGVSGIPAGGEVIIEGNYFGGTTGYSDIIDFTGGRRPGPIIQVLNNIFDGGSDDALDLDGTDAHIEGNTFRHIHQDASRASGSYAIATDSNSEIVAVRNVFYDVDHAMLLKNGATAIFDHNTVVHIRTNSFSAYPAAVISFNEPNRPGVTYGGGATLDGNIFWDIDRNRHFLFDEGVSFLTVNRSILPGVVQPGEGNLRSDPRFVNATNDFRLLPDSPAIGVGRNGLDLGALVPAGVTIRGEPLSPTPATSAALSVWGPGITSYQYQLNDGNYSAELAITNPIVLTGLSNGVYTVSVLARNSAGIWQDLAAATLSRTWVVSDQASGLWINEVLARNDRAVRMGDRFPDLVELFNNGDAAMDLKDLSLTDDLNNPRKFTFPPGTVLGPNKYLVLLADNATTPAGVHLGFGLNQDGDALYLFSGQGQLLDAVVFGLQIPDRSIGRLPGGTWDLTTPTLGAPNQPAQQTGPDDLLINEWLAAGISPGTEDFVELYNPNSLPVALSGLLLSDTPETVQNLHAIAPLSYIDALSYALFLADGNRGAGPDHLGFRLAAEQGFIGLFDPAREVIDWVYYGPQTNDLSQGRSPNGSTNIIYLPTPTPGSPNPVPPEVVGQHIVINEVMAKNIGVSLTNVLGGALANETPEWIEIYNPTATPLDLENMSLTDNVGLPRKFILPGLTLPAHGYMVFSADGSQPISTRNTGFGIKANGDTVYLFDKPSNGGSLLDAISYGVQARDFSIGRVPDGSTNWVLNLASPQALNIAVTTLGDVRQVRINEWMADPLPGDDDWFELYNPTPQPVELSGLFLTDDLGSPAGRTKFRIAPLSFLGTDFYGYERFIADNNVSAGPEHTNFKLSGSGESIGLYLSPDVPIDVIPGYAPQVEGWSDGRLPDGADTIARFATTPTPGDANYLPLAGVVINEVLSHSNTNSLEDAIELHNATAAPVDISGWFLSDKRRELNKYPIPAGTVIPAGGYAVVYEYQFLANPDLAGSFALDSAKGDQVYLSVATNGVLSGYRVSQSFGAAAQDVSFGRYTNSVNDVQFVAMSQRTFGMDHPETVDEFRMGGGAANAAPLVGPVVINEIMYHPPDLLGVDNVRDEFIELHNFTTTNVPLYDPQFPTNTWQFRDGVQFIFPEGRSIAPGEYLLVVSFDPVNDTNSLAAFRAQYHVSDSVPLVGPYRGKLDNGGESLELYRPDTPEPPGDPDAGFVPYVLVERVKYSDVWPWDNLADGSGASLQRSEPNEFGNDPANWFASSPTPGPLGLLDRDQDGMPDGWEIAHGLDPDLDDALLDLDQDGMLNIDEYQAGTRPNDPTDVLAIALIYADPVELSFTAVGDRSYIVEYRDSLGTGNWMEVATIPALSNTRIITIPDATPRGMRFYRVRMLPR